MKRCERLQRKKNNNERSKMAAAVDSYLKMEASGGRPCLFLTFEWLGLSF